VVLAYPAEGAVCTIESRLAEDDEDDGPSVFSPPEPPKTPASPNGGSRLEPRTWRSPIGAAE
jgi:hypothetical protein